MPISRLSGQLKSGEIAFRKANVGEKHIQIICLHARV
jgi:hypothetical protein